MLCLLPGDENLVGVPTAGDPGVSDPQNLFAAQCCGPSGETQSGTCHRMWDGERNRASSRSSDCIAGVGPDLTPMTYGEAVATCSRFGLELCRESCAGSGCRYNAHLVYSALSCNASDAGSKWRQQ